MSLIQVFVATKELLQGKLYLKEFATILVWKAAVAFSIFY